MAGLIHMHMAAREAVNTLNSLLLWYWDIDNNQWDIHDKKHAHSQQNNSEGFRGLLFQH